VGLRRAELCRLKVSDIDSERMVLQVQQGKGGRDRDVPLSPKLLDLLRQYWRRMKPKIYLFPGMENNWRADRPIPEKVVWTAVSSAAKAAGINKRVSPHTLRHSSRNASAGSRCRFAHDPDVARSRQAGRHDGLPASVSPPSPGGRQSARSDQRYRHERSEALEEARAAMSRPTLEVADILRASGSSFSERHRTHLALQHRKVMDAIVRCRTAALGGHRDPCLGCGHQAISYNSCRNRHCPKGQGNDSNMHPQTPINVPTSRPSRPRSLVLNRNLDRSLRSTCHTSIYSTVPNASTISPRTYRRTIPSP
jgi:hypothetical protein